MNINIFINALKIGKIIAYPTESVFGLGCDPDNKKAVYNLLTIKKRSIKKGLILVASKYSQLLKYINEKKIIKNQKKKILSTWPGMITWIMPISNNTPYWLIGDFNTIAVRVTNHYIMKKLCDYFGKPIISTSANISGMKPCKTFKEVIKYFSKKNNILIINGKTGGYLKPSEIRDSFTNLVIRKG
ncbi:Sua5/YciO/YrdC/YwlC family protein [Enterobacteriaceae endosymbiont of Donacia semicuprea]|uniref:Sua5/YciO/YrdC/YwlC family protein n=1 Tax=Enterobacteriaceae endosymbiont of Donacia semicuprea TaxID=2675783 RepID=UPI0014491408|nr:Sua5/YciO/YrdC/YwlC family protein [Enterobacteriaceae endosymbiont of Donacia semicuprea]QJC32910.1 L-threonylcarbamoyladenylate synthase type 1 TsaC [Enterobacteriaceae endosymbiont of Donacia semicuprea]